MTQPPTAKRPEILICGSGFAGSLLAWILARSGRSVAILDSSRHPRFAIGESSTPLADFLLESMSDEFDLPELKPLARWGSWQQTYPQLRAGKKRGFSYYGHQPKQEFHETTEHENSLLVAASVSDELSDTHWMRADVDSWLCKQAVAAGAELLEEAKIRSIERVGDEWFVRAVQAEQEYAWQPKWLIDATGSSGVVPQALGIQRCDDELRTQTGSLFGHFIFVQRMTGWLQHHHLPTEDDTFDGDDAAQHHVLSDGWIWMLRFDCGITSVGITRPTNIWQQEGLAGSNPHRAWKQILDLYPTVGELLGKADLFAPMLGGKASFGWMPRLSRLWSQAAGPGWLALPSTVGVIDPLHSTGLAHALSGVRRAAQILQTSSSSDQLDMLRQYDHDVVAEVRWIDRLVSLCYAGLPDFELFTAASSYYFIATHACETELRDRATMSHGFLGFAHQGWQDLVNKNYQELTQRDRQCSREFRSAFIDRLRQSIQPWNKIGLLDPTNRNRLARAATKN